MAAIVVVAFSSVFILAFRVQQTFSTSTSVSEHFCHRFWAYRRNSSGTIPFSYKSVATGAVALFQARLLRHPFDKPLSALQSSMPLLPFNVSYFFLTPKRVRLPGEVTQSPTPSPKKTTVRANSLRWSNDISVKGRSFRSLVGGKLSQPPKGKSSKDDASI